MEQAAVAFAVGAGLVIIGLSCLFRHKDWASWLRHVHDEGRRASLSMGMAHVALGGLPSCMTDVSESILTVVPRYEIGETLAELTALSSESSLSFVVICCSSAEYCTSWLVNSLVSIGSSGFWFCNCVSRICMNWPISSLTLELLVLVLLVVVLLTEDMVMAWIPFVCCVRKVPRGGGREWGGKEKRILDK